MAEGTSDEDDSSKTEEPTPKKLDESRKKGQVALSREVNNWIMLFAGTLVVLAIGPSAMSRLKTIMSSFIEKAHLMPTVPSGIGDVLAQSFFEVMGILTLPLLVLMFAAFVGPFIQIGPLFAPDTIKPDISKVSIFKGFKRLFSMRSIMEFVKGLVKIGIIGFIGVLILMPFYGQIDHMIGQPVLASMEELQHLVLLLMSGILLVLMVVAVADLLYQRYEHIKKMRMTKQELKDEYKQTEGDPHVRAKLRALRQEKARGRMMQAVPEADVIITNPTHFSIALKYDPEEMDAPVVVAKGIDDLAMRIREVAKEHDIPLVENKPLARVLFDQVDVDSMIPEQHFEAVAKVISYVFQLKGKLGPKS
ncbi:MAG: flagellar biosynthesis protein FlhB [Alphaproteobacteria bacterium]|nr:flagellar biosynthesis protein FlhB [Alphaproteobacteria bacterium]NCQ87607.1 flagellar biosynthesis protein FlhB [Alphaproteobacteria bacterium]NCT05884.1 flagellar biosynthesis protein FlhB [Alphaproteobacteria bacterium]